ncbi:MAG: hypothetical protein ABIJ56_15260 [Pseudomonadota bacterium]
MSSQNKERIIVALALVLFAASASADPPTVARIGDGTNPRAKKSVDGYLHVVSSSGSGVYHYTFNGGAWDGGLISGTGQVGTRKFNQPCLGIDAAGTLHLVYGPTANMPDGPGEPTHGVWWLTNGGEGWSSPVNIIDLYTEYLAVETDAAGVPYVGALVVVEPDSDPDLRTNYGGAAWFRRDGADWNGPWQLRAAEGKFVSMMRDDLDRIHMVYRMRWVYHSVYSEDAWHTLPASGNALDEILLPTGDFSMGAPSVTITPDAAVHVVSAACEDRGAEWVWDHARYSYNDGTGWSEETADRGDGHKILEGDLSRCAIAHDTSNRIHVFCAGSDGDLVYTSGMGLEWEDPETLDSGVDVSAGGAEIGPVFDAVFYGGLMRVVYAKSDGIYMLSFIPDNLIPPEITAFDITPREIRAGDSLTVSWTVEGNVDTVSICDASTSDCSELSTEAAGSESFDTDPGLTGIFTVELLAQGIGGIDRSDPIDVTIISDDDTADIAETPVDPTPDDGPDASVDGDDDAGITDTIAQPDTTQDPTGDDGTGETTGGCGCAIIE